MAEPQCNAHQPPLMAGPRQLRRLVDAVMAVASGLELSAVLHRIVEAATELADARFGALGVLDAERRHLAEFITVGIDVSTEERIGRRPDGHGLLGALIQDPRPIRVPDVGEHPDRAGFPDGHPPMTSFLGVPLYVRGEVFGNLYLTDKRSAETFSDIDEELVESLAAAAAIAIDNARLHERSRRLSVAAEQERIAQHLRGSVVERLTALQLEMQGTAWLTDDLGVRERVLGHTDELDLTIKVLRDGVFDRRPRHEP